MIWSITLLRPNTKHTSSINLFCQYILEQFARFLIPAKSFCQSRRKWHWQKRKADKGGNWKPRSCQPKCSTHVRNERQRKTTSRTEGWGTDCREENLCPSRCRAGLQALPCADTDQGPAAHCGHHSIVPCSAAGVGDLCSAQCCFNKKGLVTVCNIKLHFNSKAQESISSIANATMNPLPVLSVYRSNHILILSFYKSLSWR